MLIKAIKDRFKHKSAKKFIEDQLAKTKRSSSKSGISTLGCIVDMDSFSDIKVLKEIWKPLGLKPNSVHIIGFKREPDKQGMFSTPFCTKGELGWNGSIENGHFDEFKSREFDLLVNYYVADDLLLKLMTLNIETRLRAGFKGADENLNDLIFDCKLNEFPIFSKELKKYLKILNEI